MANNDAATSCDHSTSDTISGGRDSHTSFFEGRDWSRIDRFWLYALRCEDSFSLPAFVRGSGDAYGLTDLETIHALGSDEFVSSDPRYRRQTFAIRIGYHGPSYQGYQMQKGVVGVRTVEGDVYTSLGGRTSVAAGRTDRDVSAVSQVLSFTTYDALTGASILATLRASEPCRAGRLTAYEACRVPRQFQALFTATWRRYVYLFPLNRGSFAGEVDVDVLFVDQSLQRLEGRELRYNGFAFREERGGDDARSDLCTLHRARATLVSLHTPPYPPLSSSSGTAQDEGGGCGDADASPALCVELVGSRFLRRMVCVLRHVTSHFKPTLLPPSPPRQVRILVATAVRESVRGADRNEDLLSEICHDGKRERASLAVSGVGLALAGVGYDLEENKPTKGKKRAQHDESATAAVPASTAVAAASSSGSSTSPAHASAAKLVHEKRRKKRKHGDAALHVRLEVETFQHELISFLPELLYFPQRRFEFPLSQPIVVNQNMAADVGFTVWDAEVILAHYCHAFLTTRKGQVNGTLPPRIFELGAGTGLAAIVSLQHGAAVAVQELPHVLPFTLECLEMNNVQPSRAVAASWGADCVRLATSPTEPSSGEPALFDLVVMADVLYHVEDFQPLIDTIKGCVDPEGTVVIVFEQRRKDLSAFFKAISACFLSNTRQQLQVTRVVDNDDGTTDEGQQQITTTFFIQQLSFRVAP